MGLIREPKGVDFIVDPTPLNKEEKKMISESIAYFKKNGKIKVQHKKAKRPNKSASSKKIKAK